MQNERNPRKCSSLRKLNELCLNGNSNPNEQQHPIPGNRNNAPRYFRETNEDGREKRVNKPVTDPNELDPLKFKKFWSKTPRDPVRPPGAPPPPRNPTAF